MKDKIKKYFSNYTTLCITSAFLLNFLIEVFSRHSLSAGLEYVINSPLVFLYNTLIILLTYSILLLLKRKIFTYTFITVLWFAGGITNGIVLSHRVTPFTANELRLMDSLPSILDKYFSSFGIFLIYGLIGIIIVGILAAFFFAPKQKTKLNYKKNIPLFAAGVVAFSLITSVAIKSNLVSTYFGNIAFAYLDYGFPYCFTNSLLNTGIKRPINYTQETVNDLYNEIDATTVADPFDHLPHYVNNENDASQGQVKKPNILFLQLESFFDPTYMNDLTFSENPVPTFTSLREQYSSGFLTVPSVGAGTANTEFEVITGMNLEFFGPGEYPYKTILKKTTAETIGYNLKEHGYTAHAIHNNKGTFYTRQNVFKKLGFDTFTSIEYMNIDEFTPNDWAKDKFLTESIMDALQSTENEDMIYTISVQGHGDYPETPVDGHSEITLAGLEDKGRLNAFEYYVNEIHQMDDFLAELIQTLESYPEPVMLIMFGDHLPTLDITDGELENGDIFQTEYVIWDNFNLPKVDADIEAYQLSAYALNQIGVHSGILNNYHQFFSDTEDYQKNLQLLQYDMLYGNQYIYGGTNPYAATKIQMGVKPIEIFDVVQEGNNLIIKGQNFTPSSRVKINKETYTTQYIDRETLLVEDFTYSIDDIFSIQQVTVTNHVLSTSPKFSYSYTDEELNPVEDTSDEMDENNEELPADDQLEEQIPQEDIIEL